MTLKYKALLYNFLGFALIFLIVRFGLSYFFGLGRIYLVLISAIVATLLAPKFVVVKSDIKEKLMMKWIFIKGIKEI
ncbi:hypothetical protein [Costertonia aggregata]|uniref:Uncharacterized protein n=1 Tax=Costertonia aggregata TaxID=343403 RepID=A0A7H9AL51_9FLAO|nr:hypothetical protein [Costertonia aggregata]QLG44137.1 hypothetical protein HYG79_01810 [Costertonia aggregata]